MCSGTEKVCCLLKYSEEAYIEDKINSRNFSDLMEFKMLKNDAKITQQSSGRNVDALCTAETANSVKERVTKVKISEARYFEKECERYRQTKSESSGGGKVPDHRDGHELYA